MLTAFHILAPSNTLQHITEDSESIAAETYDPKPSNSGESVSRRFSENPRTTCPRKDTDWKMAVLTLMTFPFLFLYFTLRLCTQTEWWSNFCRKSTLKPQVALLKEKNGKSKTSWNRADTVKNAKNAS